MNNTLKAIEMLFLLGALFSFAVALLANWNHDWSAMSAHCLKSIVFLLAAIYLHSFWRVGE